MEILSPEIIVSICRYLTPMDLCRVSNVNKKYHDIANDNSVWKHLFVRRFPDIHQDEHKKYKDRFGKQWIHTLNQIKYEHTEQVHHNIKTYFRLLLETTAIFVVLYVVLYVLPQLLYMFIFLYHYMLTYTLQIMLPSIFLLLMCYVIRSKCVLYYELRKVKTQLYM